MTSDSAGINKFPTEKSDELVLGVTITGNVICNCTGIHLDAGANGIVITNISVLGLGL